MRHPQASRRLAELPPTARAAVQKILANPAKVPHATVEAAFAAVDYPSDGAIPLASELTPTQRALAELLAFAPGVDISSFPIPNDAWCRRRWLGLDPPGGLDHVGASGLPLWRELPDADDAAETLVKLAKRAPGDAIRAVVEMSVWAYGLSEIQAWELPSLERFGVGGEAVAPALADWLLELVDGPDWHPNRGGIPSVARWLVFLALLRGKKKIEPRWDALLPTGGKPNDKLMLRCVEALPPERRAKAILGSLGEHLPNVREEVLLALLPLVPDASLLAALDEAVATGAARPRAVVDGELAALAKKHKAIAALLGGRGAAAVRVLELRKVKTPSDPKGLTALQRKQLKGFASESKLAFTELFTVHDEGGAHVFDMHLFSRDDGRVFRAGTTTVVAAFSQGGPDTKDAALRDALALALHTFRQKGKGNAKKKPAAKKKAPASKRR